MKTICKQGASLLLVLLCLSACSNSNDKYPNEYVGFDKIKENYTLDKKTDEQDINIKIIAADKKNVDREVKLMGKWNPGEKAVFKLLDTKVVIPAKKKSATARIRIYPKMIKNSSEIYLICTPNDKEVKQSQLTLQLVTK